MPEESKTASATEKAAAPAAGSASGSGNKNGTKVIIIVVIVVVALGIIGYAARRYFAKKVAEKSVESIWESATGGDVDIDSSNEGGVTINSNSGTYSSGSKASWPATMPSSVPKFTYGNISASSSSTDTEYKTWNVSYEEISSDALTKYASAITDNGWVQSYSADSNTGASRYYDKEGYSLYLITDSELKTAIITVNTK